MASRWILSVDQLQLATERDFVPELLFVLFQERDRRHRPRDGRPRAELGEGDTLYEYAASAADVLDRLEILGISTCAAERTFAACRAKEIKRCEERIAQGDQPDFNTSTLKLLRPLTYAR